MESYPRISIHHKNFEVHLEEVCRDGKLETSGGVLRALHAKHPHPSL